MNREEDSELNARESALELQRCEQLFLQLPGRAFRGDGGVQLDSRLDAVEIRRAIGAFF